MFPDRIFSGMRPTGSLHLGHYHGVLKNWVRLQSEYPCFFAVVDWHALTTHYETPEVIEKNVWEVLIDWLASGIDPAQATLFIQSRVPEHAELALLLGMSTPLGWLERVPTYKEQIEKLKEKDLTTYGFLGYPVLMAADILLYRASLVPVGEDQVPHVVKTTRPSRRKCARCRPTRRGFAAPIPAILTSVRCGNCIRSIPTKPPTNGCRRTAAARELAALNASSR